MKLSFWILGMPAWSLEEFVSRARELGYAGIDLRVAPDGQLARDSTDADVELVKDAFAGSGVEIASLLCYNQRGNGKDPVIWDELAQELIDLARLAEKLDNRLLRISVGTPDPETGWGTYLNNLGQVTLAAAQEVPGAQLAFANHFGSASASQLFRLCERLGESRIGVVFSPDHCIVMQERPDVLAREHPSHIKQVCLADRRLNDHSLFEPCMFGEGVVPTKAILTSLAEQGWNGFVSLKWEKTPTSGLHLQSGETVLAPYVDFIRSLDVRGIEA